MYRSERELAGPDPNGPSKWAIVGNPGCRRVAHFQQALADENQAAACLVSYSDLLTSSGRWEDRFSSETYVRLESAAESWETRRLLLKYGYEEARSNGYDAISPDEVDRRRDASSFEFKPRQHYLGYRRLLLRLDQALTAANAIALQSPGEIACMYDKWACQFNLAAAGIAVPELLAQPKSFQEVHEACQGDGRSMLKMSHGSGGVGCVAMHWSRGRVRAIVSSQTMQMALPEYANLGAAVQKIDDPWVLEKVVDAICREGAHLEDWVAKAKSHGRPFDLRVVVIAGRARHAIARLGRSPFTNLNLGGERKSLDQLQRPLTSDQWDEINRIAHEVAQCFPQTLQFGLDLVLASTGELLVLEVNAFGDFLLNVFQDGKSPYAAEIAAVDRWLEAQAAFPGHRSSAT